MTARRGWPQRMLSDNGTNFVSAARELRDLVSALDHDKIQRMTSNKGLSWKWNPPAAPHFGGVFESMIKSAKRATFAVLGDAQVNDEELETIFIGVESLFNSYLKWYFRNHSLQVGDVVIVIDPGTVRRLWNVGRIEQTYPGPDGLVRVVSVRVNGKTLKRPMTRLSPLEIRETED
ncbi:uncharacterized protein [Montipora capricornis]|uniref:uncharacterized protein n=1 Tax=Montipora capricornis TaxID=246305 RepID=UPI0035F166A5